jgi:hypothetical protein
VEKEKVAAENDSAKVEADKCAVIAKEVAEKQVMGALSGDSGGKATRVCKVLLATRDATMCWKFYAVDWTAS